MSAQRLALLCTLWLAACASDPAEFRPAKSAREYPPVKDAFRVHSAPDGCDPIGVVHAEGKFVVEDIATTSANHGGTHYVVRSDSADVEYETTGVAMRGPGNTTVMRATTKPNRNRRAWAQVYRCD